jgi:hypothetical protein
MFRRAWWTRRRVVVSVVVAVLLVAAGVWVSGAGEVAVGQPHDEAKATLHRAGAVTKPCGRWTSFGGSSPSQVDCAMWELPDGRTLYLVATRDSDDEPFRVYKFDMWQGWYKSGGTPLPHAESVRLRRSVFAFLPH